VSRLFALNLAAAAGACALSLYLGLAPQSAAGSRPSRERAPAATRSIVQRGGRAGLLDASDHFTPLGEYRHIAAASTLASDLLLALCEPDRIAAFAIARDSPRAYRYAGKPTLSGAADVEALIQLRPDLVLINARVAGVDRVQRLRDAGLHVFDLGAMRGLQTLLPNLRAVATLVGRPAVGDALAQRFEQRLHSVANPLRSAARPGGLYLTLYGDTLSGGTDGTSYHDVLQAAAIHDLAADRYDDWPRYTPEAVLALNPELIVTHTGMGHALCAHPGLNVLPACRKHRVFEVDPDLLGDPGFGMLEAAETLFDAVHGAAGRPEATGG